MNFRVSRASERLVGKLDAGEEFVEALSRVCKNHGVTAGEVRAVGHFDAIELVHFDATTQSYKTLVDGEGSFDLVSLNGNISLLGEEVVLRLDAVFNVVGPLGPQMVGGQLRKARVLDGEFVIDAYSDLKMDRRLDAATGRLVLDKIERIPGVAPAPAPAAQATEPAATSEPEADAVAAEKPKEKQQTMSWSEALAETEQAEQARKARKERVAPISKKSRDQREKDPYEDLDLDEPWMAPGDILDHPKLGRCHIMKVEGDHYAHIRLPRGRIRKLALEVLDVKYQGEENGKNVFAARVRR